LADKVVGEFGFYLLYKCQRINYYFFLKKKILMFFWFFSFLIKLPIYGVHLWLPKAHVEAPVVGSMILASIMLKLGGYGLFRLSFQGLLLS
jgi:NADH-ubiquinone oxidoreductase chain 4